MVHLHVIAEILYSATSIIRIPLAKGKFRTVRISKKFGLC